MNRPPRPHRIEGLVLLRYRQNPRSSLMPTAAPRIGPANPLEAYHWDPQPQAERLIARLIEEFLPRLPFANRFKEELYRRAGVRFSDLVDHIEVPRSDELRQELLAAGFLHRPLPGAEACYVNPKGIFPAVILSGQGGHLAIKVESVVDFDCVW